MHGARGDALKIMKMYMLQCVSVRRLIHVLALAIVAVVCLQISRIKKAGSRIVHDADATASPAPAASLFEKR